MQDLQSLSVLSWEKQAVSYKRSYPAVLTSTSPPEKKQKKSNRKKKTTDEIMNTNAREHQTFNWIKLP